LVSIEYLAGFMDGEGYLALARIRRRRRSPEYCLRLCAYNTDRRVLVSIRRRWGGSLSAVGQRRPAWKPSYALIWTNAAAAKLLKMLVRHLRVKSKQAVALLEFNAHLQACRRSRDSGGHLLPLSEAELEFRARFHNRLARLNMKGKAVRGSGTSPNARLDRRRRLSKYLAGFIDAEGCLMIPKSTDSNGNSQYRARISIGNTDKPVLEEIRGRFGGIMTNQPSARVGWRHAYQLIWSDGMVERLLLSVLPYLIVKRRHAMVMLALVDHKKATRQGRAASEFARHPRKVIAFRENLRQRMKALNAKGPPAISN